MSGGEQVEGRQADRDSKARRLDRIQEVIREAGGGAVTEAHWVPGRIEVLGKHTDYAGGRSLVCAVAQGFVVAAAPRADQEVRVFDVAGERAVTLPFEASLAQPSPLWARYPATVVRRVARNFPDARCGADIGFISDLPAASGMSSSSALMVSVFQALAGINGLASTPAYKREITDAESLAGYLATVENGQSFGSLTGDRGVGTFGGSEDHTAMLCAREGELSQYSFCPVRHERQVAFPADHLFVVAVSGVQAEKTGAAKDAYNRASLAVRAILETWRAASGRQEGSLAAAIGGGSGAEQIREVLLSSPVDGFTTGALVDRFDQFVEESTVIVPSAGDALDAREFERFGHLVDRSQDLTERLLKNQVPETVALAASARQLGAVAASAFGAGFGGSVWALVSQDRVESFRTAWVAQYSQQFPNAARQATFLVTRPGPAAMRFE